MRKFIFTSIISCLFLQANAQTNNTIVNEESAWAVLSYTPYPIPLLNAVTVYYFFEGDSVFNGKTYKKMFGATDEQRMEFSFIRLVREEDKKTYFIPANSIIEYLLYDFSLEKGMNIEYTYHYTQKTLTFYVNTVDSIEIGGWMRKRIELTDYHGGRVDTWIEGIGSLKGVVSPCYNYFLVGSMVELLCYYQNNELIYKNPKYSECYYNTVSVQEVTNKSNINVYFNQTNNNFIIFDPDQIVSSVEIFDMIGKKIYSQSHVNTIDVSSFFSGVYIIKLYDINKQVSIFKIIKN